MNRGWHAVVALLLASWISEAAAHSPSDAFLTLRVDGRMLHGQLEIALRDVDVLVAADTNADRRLTWGELRAAGAALSVVARDALRIDADGSRCALSVGDLLVHPRSDGNYAWLAVSAACPRTPRNLDLQYSLLFDRDPTHRGMAVIEAGDHTQTAIFSPQDAARSFALDSTSKLASFVDYLVEGVRHIWIGIDHILFLLALLLPAVLVRGAGRWQPVNALRPVLFDVSATVTAFTIAHSVTLTLAALDVVRLPGAAVESAIAASVVLAALNNVRPWVVRRRWLLAFVFGLIHGFGFASVLGDLGLPQGLRVLSLLAFNLGVELGQLAIVAVAVPLAFAMRATAFYRIGVCQIGSLAVAALALVWLLQRSGVLQE